MSMASDLIGLGISPLLAARTATGGNGPLSIAASSSTSIPTVGGANQIDGSQYVVTVTGLASGGVLLPTIGGDAGALLADQFVINNSGTASIQVWSASAGSTVLISAGGSNSSVHVVAVHTSITLYPVSSGQWLGIKGS